jgi:uncharacterized membrane-anchored protein YjiN (DUF445 family)
MPAVNAASASALGSAGYEERRVRELRKWKRRATGFLLGALVVFLASHLFGEDEGINGFIRAASEAALIGGIADWFAVTALFRHPLGIPIPHTALIPRSKDEIGQGLAEFVHQNFLEPSNLREWIADADVAGRVATWLETPDHSNLAARRIIEAAATMADPVDDARFAALITETSLDWARQTELTPILSLLVDAWLGQGYVDESIEATLKVTDRIVVDNLDTFRETFERSSPWWVPSFVDAMVFDRIVTAFRLLVAEVGEDRTHPVRKDIERIVVGLADDLRSSPDLARSIEEAKGRVLDSPELAGWIESQWLILRGGLAQAAAEPGSELEQRLGEGVRWWAKRVLDDPDLRTRLDTWIAGSAERLAHQWEDEVIGLIETTVARWDATEVAHRLELQLGRDLQFVRINGTVVGALVGVVIHALLLLFG